MASCHIECLGKSWELWERECFWVKSPHLKIFYCLSEARKCLINYIKNPDFVGYYFKLKRTYNQPLASGDKNG